MNKQYMVHSGVPGMKWRERRYQNYDGSLTPLGRIHYGVGKAKESIGIKSDNETDKAIMKRGKYEERMRFKKKQAKQAVKDEIKKQKQAEKEEAAKKKQAEKEEAAKKKAELEKAKAETDKVKAETKKIESETEEQIGEKSKPDYSAKTRLADKSTSELTDDELSKIIGRIQKEKTLKELTYKPTTGDKIKKMLKDTAAKTAKNVGEYALDYAISRAMDAAFSKSGGADQAKEVLGNQYKKSFSNKKDNKSNNQNQNKNNDHVNNNANAITKAQRNSIKSMYANGKTSVDIAMQLGLSPETVLKYVAEANLQRK